MEIFIEIMNFIANYVPDWAAFIVCPALMLVCAVLFTCLGGRRAYAPFAGALGAAGSFLLLCNYSGGEIAGLYVALAYAALYGVFASLLGLLFLIPCPRKKHCRAEKEKARDEAIYRKFHEDLSLPPVEEEERASEFSATAEECGTSLSYVTTLLVKLKKEKLSPADRLEADALTRKVEGYRGKTLTAQELSSLNDCLSSVLKMTAKYKL